MKVPAMLPGYRKLSPLFMVCFFITSIIGTEGFNPGKTIIGSSTRKKRGVIFSGNQREMKKMGLVYENNPLKHESFGLQSSRGGASDDAVIEASTEDASSAKMKGRLTLLFVALLYGTLNVLHRQLYAMPGPPDASVLSFVRGCIASSCFLPLLPQIKQEIADSPVDDDSKAPLLMTGLELAFWNFGAQGLLNVGLLFTESARASFLTQTSVVITPLISLLAGQKVSPNVWVGCGSALLGLTLFSSTGGAGVVGDTANGGIMSSALSFLSFSSGDLIVLVAALCWSMYIFRASTMGSRYPEISLQGAKTTILACLYGCWVAATAWSSYMLGGWEAVGGLWLGWKSIEAWALLACSAIGPGALADVLQQQGQKEVSASEANVLLCAEPIFTAILGYFLLGEVTSARENAGGFLITLAAVVASGITLA